VVGGLLVDRFWWGSVFLVNGPVAIALVTATFVLVPPSRDPTSPPVDRRSALSWWLSLTFLLVAVIELPRRGLGSPLVFGAALAAGVLFIGFRRNEARTDAPLVDAETAADPRMLAGAATMGALFLGQFGVQFVLTQWLQGPQALAAIRAGSCFAPGALVSMVTPQLNPGLVERFGHRTVASAGLALAALGAALAGLAVAAGSVPGAVVAFAVVGAGVGLASASGSELIMSSAPPARAGSAAGVNETIVEAAGAVGVAVLGSALAGGHWARPLPLAAVATGGAAFLVRRLLRER
jgi:MFS family permease